ncbi:beta-hexosaminidase subunit alpha-like [Diaphorina citri]|uniref:Beta-hexosaminidase n=1 Tax=Diaphorina citri TaxID=121845 RepID=A0A3Q0JJ38_DIACI|nr:beta-hexosaminidase subunit alpha-like [Diaphorina citri]
MPVWPKPQKQVLKDEYVGVLEPFLFKVSGKSCDILEDAILRYTEILKTNWRNLTKFDSVVTAPNIVGKTIKLKIRLLNECEKYPHIDMDEKYTLEIKNSSCLLTSQSIWGILRGLETFSQLPIPAPNGDQLIIRVQTIEDFPQFPHRGLLVDGSRHYLPIKAIKKQLDIMSYNKLNVLHWHLVDDQSFPYESKKFPSLSLKGAFGPDAIYTEKMIKNVIEYARLRGIRVIPEIDTPGHTDSMEPGMPQIHCHCPHRVEGKTFVGPLDPTKNVTLDFVRDLFTELGQRFPESYVHLGGDEVDFFCWEQNPEIKAFMSTRQWDGPQLQSYYMQYLLKAIKTIRKRSVVWEEVFQDWKNVNGDAQAMSMDKDTIVQVWRGGGLEGASAAVKRVVSAGYKVINSIGWYLDNLEQEFETYHGIRVGSIDLTPEEKKLFLGGEACMWGEKVDETNIESRVWPRACAAAEHLWSSPQPSNNTKNRITEHVCRLKRRNVQAAPVYDISYCSPVIPQPTRGSFSYGRFFSLDHIRESLGLTKDNEEDSHYETVTSSSDKAPTEESATETPNPTLIPSEKKAEKSSAPFHAGVNGILLFFSVAFLLKL